MDLHTIISSGLDEKLKCFSCTNYLSYFPISICSNSRSICGRCIAPEGSTCHRQEALEVLCQHLKFPCRYQTQGCAEELSPEEVPQHEEICQFREVTCVMHTNPCNWSGNLPTLLPHCQNEHSDAFLQNGEFEIDLSQSDECDFLMECNKRIISFTRKLESHSKMLHVTICNLYQCFNENSSWQLRIQGRNTTLLHDFHPNSFEKKIYTKLCLRSVVDECSDQPLLCKIITQKIPTNAIARPQDETITSQVFNDFPKCCFCFNTLTPPIYRTLDNINFTCVTCGNMYYRYLQPDHFVNELLKFVNFPCTYQNNGCRFTSNFEQVKIHETDCRYRKEKCPLLNCNWNGFLSDTNSHITCEHTSLNLNTKSEYKISVGDIYVKCKVVKVFNRLFKLLYLMKSDSYMWAVQTMCGENETFKYQIDVVDASNSGHMVSMRKLCTPQTVRRDIFKDPSEYCYVQKDQVSSLTKSEEGGRVLTFKLRIFK